MTSVQFWRGATQVALASLIGFAIAGVLFIGAVYAGVLYRV